MKKLIFLLLLFTSINYAQKVEIGNEQNQIKTYMYVLDNFDLIKKNIPEELIYVELVFNKNSFIQKATYYDGTLWDRNNEQKKEVQVPYQLDEFIKNSFSFFRNEVFFNRNEGDGGYAFFIPLEKEKLKLSISAGNKEIQRKKNQIDTIGIVANSKFNLQINNLNFQRNKIENKKIESKLYGLNSDMIEIAPHLYLIFRIIKTNQFKTNLSIDFFEYKIMYLKGTSSSLYVWHRTEMFGKNEIVIEEIESFGGTDNLANLPYCELDENEKEGFEFKNFKFNIKIQFVK